MNAQMLRAKIVEQGMTICSFADRIGVNRSTVNRWIDNPDSLPLGMLRAIREALFLSDDDVLRIFFPRGGIR